MNNNFKINKEVILLVTTLVFITILQSCKGQEKEPKYNSKAIELNDKAVQLVMRMEYDSAFILFNQAIKIDKNYYMPYSNMIGIYLSKKQFDKALHASDKVVAIKPDLAEGWTFGGILYDSKGDSLTAKKYYIKSIEIYDNRINNPEKKKSLTANRINRAVSLILLGKELEGKDELRELRADNPDNLMIDEFLKINKHDYIRQLIDNE